MISLRLFACLGATLAFVACDRSGPGPTSYAPDPPAEKWAALPPGQWPQLVLTNTAVFRGRTDLSGASGFMIQGPESRIYAATALHLLGTKGGVEPPVEPRELEAALVSWRMAPRTKPNAAIAIAGPAYDTTPKKGNDWLLLFILGKPVVLPSTPLTPRPSPIAIDEEVFLAGVPYGETTQAQNIYRGHVTERAQPDRFRFTVDPPVDLHGFSGAPIVDRHGLLVGLMTIWFEPKAEQGKQTEAGGEDVATILPQLH